MSLTPLETPKGIVYSMDRSLGAENWSVLESNFGVEYLGYLMATLALNMLNI